LYAAFFAKGREGCTVGWVSARGKIGVSGGKLGGAVRGRGGGIASGWVLFFRVNWLTGVWSSVTTSRLLIENYA
jgi:hypothetical protein